MSFVMLPNAFKWLTVSLVLMFSFKLIDYNIAQNYFIVNQSLLEDYDVSFITSTGIDRPSIVL